MNKVRKKRRELEFSQYEIEKLTGITQSKLSLIEQGYREASPEEKRQLAKVLKSEICELFD